MSLSTLYRAYYKGEFCGQRKPVHTVDQGSSKLPIIEKQLWDICCVSLINNYINIMFTYLHLGVYVFGRVLFMKIGPDKEKK